MARQYSSGFEFAGSGSNIYLEDETQGQAFFLGADAGGSFQTYITTSPTPRSGKYACQFAPGSGTWTNGVEWFPNAPGDPAFARTALYIKSGTAPSTQFWPLSLSQNATTGLRLRVHPDLSMTLENIAAGTVIATLTASLTTNAWHVIEISYSPSTGAVACRIDGIADATGTAETTSQAQLIYAGDSAGGCTCVHDDVAYNDSSGSAQNSWPGLGGLWPLFGTADSSNTGFKRTLGGTTVTTGLFNAVNHIPQTGLVRTSGSATSQIGSNTSNITDNYVVTLQTPSAAGVPSGQTAVLAIARAWHGNSSATSRTNGVTAVSNPAIAEGTGTTGTTAAGTWPTGWSEIVTAYQYSPTIVYTTAPTVKVRKGTASTDYAMFDEICLLVEYVASSTNIPRTHAMTQSSGIAVARTVARGVAMTQSKSTVLQHAIARAVAIAHTATPALGRSPTRALAVVHTGTATVSRVVSRPRAPSPTQTQAVTFSRVVGAVRKVTQSQTPALAHSMVRGVVVSHTASPAVGRAIPRAIASTQAQTPVVARAAARHVATTQSQAVVMLAGKAYLGTVTATQSSSASVTRTKATADVLSTSQARTPAVARSVIRSVIRTQSSAATLKRTVAAARAATQSATATLRASFGRVRVAGATPTPTAAKHLARAVLVSQSTNAVKLRARAYFKLLIGSQGQAAVSIAGHGYSKGVAATQASSAGLSLHHVFGRVKAPGQHTAVTVARPLTRHLAVAQGQTPVSHRVVSVGHAAGGRSVALALKRSIARVHGVSDVAAVSRVRDIARKLAGAQGQTGSQHSVPGCVPAAGVTPTVRVSRTIAWFEGGVIWQFTRPVALKRPTRVKSATRSSAATLRRTPGRVPSAVQSQSASQRPSVLRKSATSLTTSAWLAHSIATNPRAVLQHAGRRVVAVVATRRVGQTASTVVRGRLGRVVKGTQSTGVTIGRYVVVARRGSQASSAVVRVTRRPTPTAMQQHAVTLRRQVTISRQLRQAGRLIVNRQYRRPFTTTQLSSASVHRVAIRKPNATASSTATMARMQVRHVSGSQATSVGRTTGVLSRHSTTQRGRAVVVPSKPIAGVETGLLSFGFDGLVYPYAIPSADGMPSG